MGNRLISRRSVLLGAGGFSLLPLRLPAQPKAPSLPLVVVGDWGEPGSSGQPDVAREMGREAERIGSAFTISVGDNFYEEGVTSTRDPKWVSLFEQMYTAPSLQTRWDAILGNHDYRGDVQAQIDYSAGSQRWRMPARYFSRRETLADGTSVDFFYIDTNPFISAYRRPTDEHYEGMRRNAPGPIADQAKWLDDALGRSDARWKIVVGHHPIHTVSKRDEPDMVAQIKPVLERHNVPLYVNGHVHNLQCVRHKAITYVTTGAGGRKLGHVGHVDSTQFARETFGFVTLDIARDRIAHRFIDGHGQEVYAGQIAA
jgi:tartrate-resistant acid phosphatase type 5